MLPVVYRRTSGEGGPSPCQLLQLLTQYSTRFPASNLVQELAGVQHTLWQGPLVLPLSSRRGWASLPRLLGCPRFGLRCFPWGQASDALCAASPDEAMQREGPEHCKSGSQQRSWGSLVQGLGRPAALWRLTAHLNPLHSPPALSLLLQLPTGVPPPRRRGA